MNKEQDEKQNQGGWSVEALLDVEVSRGPSMQGILPPWLKYPDCPRLSIGWRMGGGEQYMNDWSFFVDGMDRQQFTSYISRYAPIPKEWRDLVEDVLKTIQACENEAPQQ